MTYNVTTLHPVNMLFSNVGGRITIFETSISPKKMRLNVKIEKGNKKAPDPHLEVPTGNKVLYWSLLMIMTNAF